MYLFLICQCLSFVCPEERSEVTVSKWEKSSSHYHEKRSCLNLCSWECWVGYLAYHIRIIDSLVDCLQLNSCFQFFSSLVTKMSSITNRVGIFSETLPQLDPPEPFRRTSHISGWCDIWLRAAVSISRIIILPF